MATHVALLRAVNVGRATPVRMGQLREALAGARFRGVHTLLQSGNIVFETARTRRSEIERSVEDVVAEISGRRTDCFVRTASEWQAVIDRNPFPQETARAPGLVTVLVLKDTPPAHAWEELQATITGREITRGEKDHGYVVYPDGQGHTRLTMDRIERAVGTRGTIRNWNTVTKIGALLAE